MRIGIAILGYNTDMSFMTAKNIMFHWNKQDKESEKIRCTWTSLRPNQRIIADRKRISRAFIVGGLLLVASQVFRI